MAVEITPVPSGLVRISESSTTAEEFVQTRSGWIIPVTEYPNLISGSRTLCPPITVHWASIILERPPARICSRTEMSPLSGKQTIASALSGLPPMAYTSLRELTAAIWPKVKGSSTIGVKKSTVCTNACSAEILYTPASSALSKPTSTFSSCCRANFPSTESSTAGLSLLAQPAAFTCSVSRTLFTSAIGEILKQTDGQNCHKCQNCHNWEKPCYTIVWLENAFPPRCSTRSLGSLA